MKEDLIARGEYKVVLKNKQGVETMVFSNALTNGYVENLLHFVSGEGTFDPTIKYVALGNGTLPASPHDTKLSNEIIRLAPTQITTENNYVQVLQNLLYDEANFNIYEIGLYAGDATHVKDSGTLISRANVTIFKNTSTLVNIIWRNYIQNTQGSGI